MAAGTPMFRRATLVGLVVAMVGVLPLVLTAPPATAASAPAGLPPLDQCATTSGNEYCLGGDNNDGGTYTSTGYLGDGGTATLTIDPNVVPCGDTNSSGCMNRVSWSQVTPVRCLQDLYSGAGWVHTGCTGTTVNQAGFLNTLNVFNAFASGALKQTNTTTGANGCTGAYNSTYGPGGPPGATWPMVASNFYTCTLELTTANRFYEIRGETWAIFQVTLQLRVDGCYGCEVRTLHIPVRISGARTLAPGFDVDYERPQSLTAHFTNTTTGEPGHALEHTWSFGDGAQSTELSPSHTYANPGIYFATLQVKDPYSNLTRTASRQVRVPDTLAVTCNITPSGPGGSVLDFSTTILGGTGATAYDWTFSDGSSATTPTAQRTAEEPGTFSASVTVTDDGETASDDCEAQVRAPELIVEILYDDGSDYTQVQLGGTEAVQVTLRAGTDGLGDLTNVHFVDPLLVDPPSMATVAGPVPAVPAGLTLAQGEEATFDFELTGAQLGWFELISNATATDAAGNSVGLSDGWAEGIVAPSPLQVTIDADPTQVAPGDEITVEIEVTNTGDTEVWSVESLLKVDWEPEAPSDEPTVSVPSPKFQDLAPGASHTFTRTVVAPTRGALTLTGRATGMASVDPYDPVTSNRPKVEVEVGTDLIVNSVADTDDDDPGDQVCDTGGTVEVDGDQVPECTLRAAISEANAGDLDEITFDIPGTPVIAPLTALPELTGPATLDASTQPTGMVQVSGGSAGDDAAGLVLGGSEVTVRGLAIVGFDGAGIVLDGDGGHVLEQNLIGVTGDGATVATNGSGIKVISPGNVIGGNGVGNGIANTITEAPEPPAAGAGEDALEDLVADLPANILVLDGGSAEVSGNDISGLVPVFAFGALGDDGLQVMHNKMAGWLALGAFTTAGAITMSDNEVSTKIGVMALPRSGATLVVDDNDFDSAQLGAMLIGAESMAFTNNRITNTVMGVLSAVGSDGTHVEGNVVTDTKLGVMVIGSSRATFAGNQIDSEGGIFAIGGSSTLLGGNTFADNEISSDIGMILLGEDSSQITGNTLTSPDMGFLLARMQAATIADNTIDGAKLGMLALNVGGAAIDGNSITNGGLAALVGGIEPTADEKATGTAEDAPTDAAEIFDRLFVDQSDDIGLRWANASQQIIEVDQSVIYSTPVNADLSTWTGNVITGNDAGLLIAGTADANLFGGTAPGAGNTISGNRAFGLVLAGEPGPQEVTIRGNAIFGNGTAAIDTVPAGVPDVRFLLKDDVPATFVTPTPNDPGDADSGPNGFQNHPLITSVAADGSSVGGELWSAPNGSYLVDLYAASACHVSGHGGAERYLGEVLVTTGADGRGTFTTPTSLGAGEVVTATATTTGGFVDGATSEFSRCASPGLVATATTEAAEAGDTTIEVSDNGDFEIGNQVTINEGGANEEDGILDGFGSLILRSPLAYDHAAGELIVQSTGVPSAPRNATAVAGDQTAGVSWDAPLSDGGTDITAYTVTATEGAFGCTTAGALTCTVTGLPNDVARQFVVVATNVVGDGPPSDATDPVTPTAVDTNTPPVVAVIGVDDGATHEAGDVPVAACTVEDLEDGSSSVDPLIDPDLDEHGLGTVTVTCAHTDTGGLSDEATAIYTVQDTTDPWISGSIPAPGWHTGDVVISWTCGDGGSGVVSCPPPTTITGEGTDLSATGTVVDHAGNSTSVTVDGIDIDRTLPVITWSGPTSYTVGQTLAVGCSATDELSGIASSTCPTATGSASTPGTFTLTATATDDAGNTATSMRTYTVAPAVTFDSLIALTSELAGKGGKGMVAILKAAKRSADKGKLHAANSQLDDYVEEVHAQTGRSLTTAEAQQLLDLAAALRQSL